MLGANVRPVSVLVLNQMGVTFQKMGGWLGGRKKVNWLLIVGIDGLLPTIDNWKAVRCAIAASDKKDK